jgi:hypothetical protein
VLAMQSAHYAAHVHNPVAFGGALVGLLTSVTVVTVLTVVYPKWPRGRWFSGRWRCNTGGVVLRLDAPGHGRVGWLTILLAVLITVAYEAVATAWLVVARPWNWMKGAPG